MLLASGKASSYNWYKNYSIVKENMAQNGYYNGNHLSSPSKGAGSRTSSPEDKHFVVAAIDFGTTYSGYAFSFTRDPDSIHMMRKWEGGDPGVNNQKTPTTLLLKPNGEFHSFGFSARDYYHDLEESEAKRWYYFEKFKMSLHSSQVCCMLQTVPNIMLMGCFDVLIFKFGTGWS